MAKMDTNFQMLNKTTESCTCSSKHMYFT